ncbi:alpha/beta fold hydrolase [Candidatus Bipolaricaulota bacterium]
MDLAQDARSDFVNANGARLHYLDWGGDGPALIFLAGYANTPHFFDSLATAFIGRFHVLGLTRRAHGESEQPESAYDLPALAMDILGFMDALGIEKAVLAGHSFAGGEMAYLAAHHPDRLSRLVFLDALYDYTSADVQLFGENPVPPAAPPPESFESVAAYCEDFVNRYPSYRRLRSPRWDALWALTLDQRADGRFVEKIRPETAKLLSEGLEGFEPDWRDIRCPTLVFYAIQTADWTMPDDPSPELKAEVVAYTERMNREFKDRNVEHARKKIPDVQVVVFEDTSHYCFLDREDNVIAAMRTFLAQ